MAARPRSSPGREIPVRSPNPPRNAVTGVRCRRLANPSHPGLRTGPEFVGLRGSVGCAARVWPGVNVSAEPSASIWEVTRLILDSPGTSPSAIAHAHGFSAVEVAELLPIFLDNLRTNFSRADGPAPELVPPAPQPGETPEEHAERYLRELAENEDLDVVGYDTLGGGQNGEIDGFGGEEGNERGELAEDPTFLDGLEGESGPTAPDAPSGEETVYDGGRAIPEPGDQPGPDRPDVDELHELVEDDPFAPTGSAADETGVDDASSSADEPLEPFAID
jgi:hypothetical protein